METCFILTKDYFANEVISLCEHGSVDRGNALLYAEGQSLNSILHLIYLKR